MAVRGVDVEEEKKSYGSVFVLGAILLVFVGVWAVYDDNFTRRPWKKYQTEFYRLDYLKANAAYEEEDRKLKADALYRELVNRLEAEKISLSGGELAKKLSEYRSSKIAADVRFTELDQEVKFIKSQLEEASYEYDHAVQTDIGIRPYEKRIEELNQQKAKIDPVLEEARQRREQIKNSPSTKPWQPLQPTDSTKSFPLPTRSISRSRYPSGRGCLPSHCSPPSLDSDQR